MGSKLLVVVLMLLAAGGTAAQSLMMQPGRWQGAYDCAQGSTPAVLTIRGHRPQGAQQAIEALFDFGGGQRPKGAYLLRGTYDPASRQLKLEPAGWLSRPGQYVAVGFQGRVASDGASFEGRMDFHLCGRIQLSTERPPEPAAAPVPQPAETGASGPTPMPPERTAQAPTPTPTATPAPAPAPAPAKPRKPFGELFRLQFGARIDAPGCSLKTITEKALCLQPPGVMSDRPVAVDPNGKAKLLNAHIGFLALTLLEPMGVSQSAFSVELRDAKLAAIEISPYRDAKVKVDADALVARLSRHFGEPERLVRQRSVLFLSEQERKARNNPTFEVTTYRWWATDAMLEFECYYGCSLKAVGQAALQ